MAVQVPSMVDSRTRAEVEADVIADYRASSPRSAALHAAARRVMPGGDTRTVAFHAPYPLSVSEGQGCRIQDADGRTYIDLLNNYTSLIHGHGHPGVVAAVSAHLPHGTAFPAPNEAQTRLAEILVERVDSVEMARFTNSGTEAVMSALVRCEVGGFHVEAALALEQITPESIATHLRPAAEAVAGEVPATQQPEAGKGEASS